ncbi:MAG: peptidase family, catalytic domain protein [Acidimicrobiales bacterium]|nr:peptidase family, catalytic domain protein [Acidimicrobiales bacterium]
MADVRRHGSWPSPITAALLVQDAVSLGQVEVGGDRVWWLEGRPAEAGRQVVVTWARGEEPHDVVPEGFSARTTVHEYGGGSYATYEETVFFSNFTDQRIYRVDRGGDPRPLTPEPPAPMAFRYADARVTGDGTALVCVRERHLGGEVVNDIVAVDALVGGEPVVLVTGADFFSAPRLSPDGSRLAWLCWSHPHMPWDGTELWTAEVSGNGLAGACRVAGGPEESVSQPRWSPDGVLHWVSDRSGWWNLYADDGQRDREGGSGAGRPLLETDAEFTGPDWVFGQATYDFLPDGRLVVTWWRNALAHLGVLDGATTELVPWDTPYSAVGSLKAYRDGAVAIAASATEEPAVVVLDGNGSTTRALRRSRPTAVDAGYVSAAEPIEFSTEGSRTAHALWYPPANRDVEAPAGELPPLIVMSHGGPTSSASPALSLSTQFWTSRGFAVVDVNYGGSTGYGREYRQRLRGQWGVVDVDDCVNAARHLAAEGLVDGGRVLIRGGSAGGYTTLCALTFRDDFSAGASYFGVADAEALATDTHKFESRYLDGLIGPYPDAQDLYRERSPIHYADRLSAPLILFQGLEDKVVPPAQAEVMVAALQLKGLPYAYVAFEGEQHGFRKAETIVRAIEAELSFYGTVLGFDPADEIEPVTVENLG